MFSFNRITIFHLLNRLIHGLLITSFMLVKHLRFAYIWNQEWNWQRMSPLDGGHDDEWLINPHVFGMRYYGASLPNE